MLCYHQTRKSSSGNRCLLYLVEVDLLDRYLLLRKEKIGKLIWKFSLPAIASTIVNAVYNVIDRIFVGRGVNSLALSGVAVAMPFTMILSSFALLIGTGAAIQVSIKLGENKKEQAEKIIGNALFLGLVTAFILPVIGFIFMEPLLIAFGGNIKILLYAKEFMQIMLLSTVFMNVFQILNSAIQAEGNPVMALVLTIVGTSINMVLNPLFIFEWHLGIRGSALATLISQLVTASWAVIYFFYNSKSLLKIKWANFIPEKTILLNIISFGIAPFLIQNLTSLSSTAANHVFMTYGGNTALAVVGIVGVLSLLFILPITGIAQGIQPILGFNYGEKNYDRVKRIFVLASLNATILCLFDFIIIFFFSQQLISFFSQNDQNIIHLGAIGIKYSMITMPVIGFQIIGSTYFQAVGKYKQAIFLTISRLGLFLIPLLFLLSSLFGLYGGIAAFPISDFLAGILVTIFIIYEWKNLDSKKVLEA